MSSTLVPLVVAVPLLAAAALAALGHFAPSRVDNLVGIAIAVAQFRNGRLPPESSVPRVPGPSRLCRNA